MYHLQLESFTLLADPKHFIQILQNEIVQTIFIWC